MTATTKRKPPRPPTRKESDARVDRALANAGVDAESADLVIELLKEAQHKYAVLRAYPNQTPAITEKLDQLRRELRELMAELGLTPAAKKALGLSPVNSLGAQNRSRSTEDVILAYRRPAEHTALLHDLVKRGAWDAVGNAIKAQMQIEPEEQDHEEGRPDQTDESGPRDGSTAQRVSAAERRRALQPLRAIPGGAGLAPGQDAPDGA